MSSDAYVKVQDDGVPSMKVPDVHVTLGSSSSSEAVNTKVVIAVPILLY